MTSMKKSPGRGETATDTQIGFLRNALHLSRRAHSQHCLLKIIRAFARQNLGRRLTFEKFPVAT